ncbi:MAG: hypothetical protein KC442_09855 [Thermomicrobiales bacterium]|nr:hypothetical protein [Thermomicrobiales bacterium]MCA9878078.1 hypothetical protein [Thermomicrobiales bacterium]
MIHHMSFGVQDTRHVAHVLAELLGARAIQAPTPPFPYGAWLVCAGDAYGSFLEIVPQTTVFDPDAPLGVRQRPARAEVGSAHVLVRSPLSATDIQTVASRAGWRAQEVETGLFRIIKLWIEDVVLVELLAQGDADRYVKTFGTAGMASLDGKLRALESEMAVILSTRLSPEMLAEAIGTPVPARQL